MIELKNIKTKYLSKELINNICALKESHWRFGLPSQKKWFKKNNQKNDFHNLLFYKKKLIGYTGLRKKLFHYGKKRKYYLLFDTLIISKKYRKSKLSNILMNYNNYVIKKLNYHSFLLCNTELINFYKKFQWKSSNYKINFDFKSERFKNKKILSYNFKNNKYNKDKLIINF